MKMGGKLCLDCSSVRFAKNDGVALQLERSANDIHWRTSEKAGYEEISWLLVEFQGCIILLDLAVIHHDDAIPHGHRFDLIVGDVNHGGLQTLMQLYDFGAHLHTHLGVEIRQRFIKKKNSGLTHDGAPDCHSLPLSAGKRFRLPIQ